MIKSTAWGSIAALSLGSMVIWPVICPEEEEEEDGAAAGAGLAAIFGF